MGADSLRRFRQWYVQTPNDAPAKTLLIAFAVAMVCALGVSAATVVLRPVYYANMETEKSNLVLDLMKGVIDGDLTATARVIYLDSGEAAPDYPVATFDGAKAAQDPATSRALEPSEDLAGIGRLSTLAMVHEIESDGQLRAVVLPVQGRGYASTLFGYLAVAADGITIQGLRFFDHGETPGIGGRVDDADWLAQWRARMAYDDQGQVIVDVVRGDATERHQVHAITGATYTSRGVHNLVRFWLGPLGYGPYLKRLQRGPS